MKERAIDIPMADGTADAYLYFDETAGPKAGVAFYTDIFGIRDANRQMAERLAADGFTVLMPNVFYRTAKPPIISRDAPDEEIREQFAAIREPLTPVALRADAEAYVKALESDERVSDGNIGAVGYCFTGKLALCTAAARPDKVAAAASFHGGGLFTAEPDSPHRLLPRIDAELYFGHAEGDRSMPAEAIAKLEEALIEWGGGYESETYSGAGHGWTVPDSQAYASEQAEKAYSQLLSLFRRAL